MCHAIPVSTNLIQSRLHISYGTIPAYKPSQRRPQWMSYLQRPDTSYTQPAQHSVHHCRIYSTDRILYRATHRTSIISVPSFAIFCVCRYKKHQKCYSINISSCPPVKERVKGPIYSFSAPESHILRAFSRHGNCKG